MPIGADMKKVYEMLIFLVYEKELFILCLKSVFQLMCRGGTFCLVDDSQYPQVAVIDCRSEVQIHVFHFRMRVQRDV